MAASIPTLSESIRTSSSHSSPLVFVIGIDPGSGVSSPTGLTIVEATSKEILLARNVYTKYKDLPHRIKDISDQIQADIDQFLVNVPKEAIVIVCIESFVMRGKGGETLQRLIGSFLGRIPYHIPVEHIANTRVKLALAGHGHAEKEDVAKGVLTFFKSNKNACETIIKLTNAKEADILDSLAIGVAGWLQAQGKGIQSLRKSQKKKSRK